MEILRAERVVFRYPQYGQGVAPFSLAVGEGEAYFIHGPSGCGKSTLARCLTGLIPHLYHGDYSGSVFLEGKRTDQTALWELSKSAGLVFQNPAAQMLAATVEEEIIFGLENLGLQRDEIINRLKIVLEQFNLNGMRKRSPVTLSGGEQQKLALASIIARQPRILVFDEPLSMLDTTAAFELIDLLASQAEEGHSMVICEHKQEYVQTLVGVKELCLGCKDEPSSRSPLKTLPASTLPGTNSNWELKVSDVSVRRGGQTVLDGIRFNEQNGQIIALVGRNGAGKTTLLRAMAGLQTFSGKIAVCQNGEETRPDFGLVFQNPDLQLFNASVREEILYRVQHPDLDLYDWLVEVLNLKSYEQTPPLLLSEGEKRRVALATIMMQRPRHGILLDEPALGQDDDHKRIMLQLFRAAAEAGMMVIFSTHDIELAAQADQMMLLQPNGIVTSGPPDQVLADENPWQMIGLQVPTWVFKESHSHSSAHIPSML